MLHGMHGKKMPMKKKEMDKMMKKSPYGTPSKKAKKKK